MTENLSFWTNKWDFSRSCAFPNNEACSPIRKHATNAGFSQVRGRLDMAKTLCLPKIALQLLTARKNKVSVCLRIKYIYILEEFNRHFNGLDD